MNARELVAALAKHPIVQNDAHVARFLRNIEAAGVSPVASVVRVLLTCAQEQRRHPDKYQEFDVDEELAAWTGPVLLARLDLFRDLEIQTARIFERAGMFRLVGSPEDRARLMDARLDGTLGPDSRPRRELRPHARFLAALAVLAFTEGIQDPEPRFRGNLECVLDYTQDTNPLALADMVIEEIGLLGPLAKPADELE